MMQAPILGITLLARLFGLPPPGAASGDGVLVLPAEGVCDSRTRATSSSSEPLCLILNPLSRGVERPGSSSGTLVSERSEEALRYLRVPCSKTCLAMDIFSADDEFYHKAPSHNTGHGTGAHWH